MPKFVSNRDFVLNSRLGHSVAFVKGEPTHVPKELVTEALTLNLEPVDELEPTVAPLEPTDKDERQLAFFEAFEKIVEANVRESFGANGIPNNKALKAQGIDWQFPASERDAAWAAFTAK